FITSRINRRYSTRSFCSRRCGWSFSADLAGDQDEKSYEPPKFCSQVGNAVLSVRFCRRLDGYSCGGSQCVCTDTFCLRSRQFGASEPGGTARVCCDFQCYRFEATGCSWE